MAALTTQQIALAGTVITPVAATASTGDTFTADDHTWLMVVNGSGSSINVTITIAQKGPAATTIGPLVVAVAATTTKHIGPFPAAFFQDPVAGNCTVVCSAVTTVTIAAVRAA